MSEQIELVSKDNSSITVARDALASVVAFLVNIGLDATIYKNALSSIGQIIEGQNSRISRETAAQVLPLILQRRLETAAQVLAAPPYELTASVDRNAQLMNTWRQIQSACESAMSALIVTDKFAITAPAARWLYDEFGDAEFLPYMGDSAYENAKDDLLHTDVPHVSHMRYWTRRMKRSGVYNIEPLRAIPSGTPASARGVDMASVELYDTINLSRPTAQFAEHAYPARSRVAVYNASLEQQIFQNMRGCARFQLNTRSNVKNALLSGFDVDVLTTSQSHDDMTTRVCDEIYRILHSVYSRENISIKNRREMYFMFYFIIHETIQKLKRAFSAAIERFKYPIPIPQHVRAEATGALKNMIYRVFNDVNLDSAGMDIEQTVCV